MKSVLYRASFAMNLAFSPVLDSLEHVYRQRCFISPKAACPLLAFKVSLAETLGNLLPGQGVQWEYLQEECRNSIFFFVLPLFLVRAYDVQKPQQREGLAIPENQKDYADFDHLHLIQCKITAPGSLASRHASEMEAYYTVHRGRRRNERGLLSVL